MVSKTRFQEANFTLILYAIALKWITFGFPTKIGHPRYVKGMLPAPNPSKLVIIRRRELEMAPE
jgi:hypothetical protein